MVDKKDFLSDIGKMLKNIDPDTLKRMMEKVQSTDFSKEFENMMEKKYKYNVPSYSELASPMPDYLHALYSAKGISDTLSAYNDLKAKMRDMEQETREDAMRNFFLNILADAQKNKLDFNTGSQMPVWGALAIVEHFQLNGLWDILLEMLLKQNYTFSKFYVEEFIEDAEYIIAKTCCDHLDELEKMLHNEVFIITTYSIILNSVVLMAKYDKANRLKYIAWIGKNLVDCIGKSVDPDCIDRMLLALSDAKATELLPVLKNMYERYDIPPITAADYKEAEKIVRHGNGNKYIEYSSLEELLEKLAKNEKEYDKKSKKAELPSFEDFLENFNFAPLDDGYDDDAYWEEYFDTSKKNVEMFSIRVSLEKAPFEISRQLEVPSNIRLDTLASCLVYAMGWEGNHLNQFKANGEFYEEVDEAGDAFYREVGFKKKGQYEFTLKELLNRKGKSIIWEYDFGDSWEHSITLEDRRKKSAYEDYSVNIMKGKNACPPENCGGVYGYKHLLDVLADPKSPEYMMMKNWVPRNFNPKKFNKKKAQKLIDDYLYD